MRMDAAAVVEWARKVPVDEIPTLLVFLSGRLLEEGSADRTNEHRAQSASDPDKLLTARELSERLNLPESWLRSREHAGLIPSIRAGKYVRFREADVVRALTERERPGSRNR